MLMVIKFFENVVFIVLDILQERFEDLWGYLKSHVYVPSEKVAAYPDR